jgi:alkylation response protein AidB-like acyl-CoA dehydrogenase
MLNEVAKLGASIHEPIRQHDQMRRISPEVIAKLRSIGLFRMFVPRRFGGLEMDMPSAIEVLTALGKIDGSVGWTAMIGAGAALVAPELPEETYERIYASGPDVMFAGSFLPSGVAEPAHGGWRVTGRWPFASGCSHAEWIFGLCAMHESTQPQGSTAPEKPAMRAFVLRANEWQIEDTWHVMGLRGTGSHHVALGEAIVPEENFFLPAEQRWFSGPLYDAVPRFIPLLHAANNLGIAEGAIADLTAIAQTGRRQQRAATSMRESEYFKIELGRAYADLLAARAFLRDQTQQHWNHALAGTLGEKALDIAGSQMTVWMSAVCVRIVDTCLALAGSNALYEHALLERRMRDIHAAAQHAALQPRNYLAGGTFLLDSDRR